MCTIHTHTFYPPRGTEMGEKTSWKSKNELARLDLAPTEVGAISLHYHFASGKCIWLSCVHFLMSDFDLSKGATWRVNVIELKQHTMELQDKFVAILENVFWTFYNADKTGHLGWDLSVFPQQVFVQALPLLSRIKGRSDNLI